MTPTAIVDGYINEWHCQGLIQGQGCTHVWIPRQPGGSRQESPLTHTYPGSPSKNPNASTKGQSWDMTDLHCAHCCSFTLTQVTQELKN